ncbi:hypothetical protein BKA66DRAFT_469479 [Pyrenochaeta sp. MPI-SDFR-AT-0127]|nr:hypothetical protein BKA66DRAFT_469479 [Pyrenochaeta sp. MPI-SDFR-AT-0127]
MRNSLNTNFSYKRTIPSPASNMSDPVTYSFYGTTVPVLRNIATSAISILNAAKTERSSAAEDAFPSEQELLDSQFSNMLPFRVQPILLAKFSIAALQHLQLHGTTPLPVLSPAFASFDDVIEFFKQSLAVFDAIDETKFNESAEKSVDIPFEQAGVTLQMTGFADYFHGFVIPNSYFHLNAMYMLLRSKGFKLGKGVYVGCWMSDQQKKDWAPLKG